MIRSAGSRSGASLGTGTATPLPLPCRAVPRRVRSARVAPVPVGSAARISGAQAGTDGTGWPAATSRRGARDAATAVATQRSMLIPSRRPNASPAATATTGTAAMPTTAGGTSGVRVR